MWSLYQKECFSCSKTAIEDKIFAKHASIFVAAVSLSYITLSILCFVGLGVEDGTASGFVFSRENQQQSCGSPSDYKHLLIRFVWVRPHNFLRLYFSPDIMSEIVISHWGPKMPYST